MKNSILTTHLPSIIITGLLMVACGSNSTVTEPPATAGKVIDDYIAGATVCADVNNNGIADDGAENCVLTDEQGGFRFSSQRVEPLVMSGGIDIGTGKEFKGTFLAPPESTVINPLTTLVSSVINEGNKTKEEAQEIVKTHLGLEDSNIDLTTFDPLKELQFGEDSTTKEVAKEILAQQTAIQVILTVTATTISASSNSIQENNITIEASNQIAQLMLQKEDNSSLPEITSRESIQIIIEETAQETLSENTEALASVTSVVNVVATQVEEITKNTIINIEAVDVNDEENSGLDVIEESNAVVLLVTNTEKDDSIKNIIEEAVTTGTTSTLESIDIANEIENSQDELIERAEVEERDNQDTEVRVTGGEGGTP